MEVCFLEKMGVEVVKMEVCMTYPMNQHGLIDFYAAKMDPNPCLLLLYF